MTTEQRDELLKKKYMYKKKIGNITYDVFFFGSWSGYAHPVLMQNPINYPETQAGDRLVYYEASYMNHNDTQQFVRLEKIMLKRKICSVDYLTNVEGIHYYLVDKTKVDISDDDIRLNLGQEVELMDTVQEREYFRISYGAAGNVKECIKVHKNLMYSYDYIYSEGGILQEVIIKDDIGSPPKKLVY